MIYLDNNATTPLDPEVLEAMMPYLTSEYGNSTSQHAFGYTAARAIKLAREQVAALLNCSANEVYWTSGATESNNLALWGVIKNFASTADCHAVTSCVEHKAVLEVFAAMAAQGAPTTLLTPQKNGAATAEQLSAALRPKTQLVSLMAANNEIGTLNPIAELVAVAHAAGALFHCDAVQALGKIPFDVRALNVDMASFSAHKLYGPKGVGALYVRSGLKLQPLLQGGQQEAGLRPGTLNVAGIVGFGKACALALASRAQESSRLRQIQEFTWRGLKTISSQITLNGDPTDRLPGHLNVTDPRLDMAGFGLDFSQFAVSQGSACSFGQPSHVLLALGLSREMARQTVRIGFGRFNTMKDAELLVSNWEKITRQAHPDLLRP